MNSQTNNDNQALLQEIKRLSVADDPQAISMIYECFFQRLIRFSFSFVKTREAAEEVVEDVIIKWWRNKTGIDAIENLSVYFFTAVRNQSLNYLERQAKYTTAHLSGLDNESESHSISPLEHLIISEMNQELQVAVATLPERCQLIFRLVREEGLKYKEIADILNISINTIDNQMAIAVRRICASLHIKKGAPYLKAI